jgi:glycosyltransferase involved in cell wall biosynthesis
VTETTLGVTLLVRDEADIIAATIEFYLAQANTSVIVTDNGSTDGTSEILAAYERSGHIVLINEPALDYRQGEWVTRMAQLAASSLGVDWVINADADEFWVPVNRSLTLAQELGRVGHEFDIVRASRQDLRYTRMARDTRPWPERLHWRDTMTVSAAGTPLGAKSAHRASPTAIVAQGNHDVAGLALNSVAPTHPLDILHVPLRSWAQFSRKIDNGGSAYESNVDFPADMGWHWRDDYQLQAEGGLHREVRGRLLSPQDIVRGVARGRIKRDDWLNSTLHGLREKALHPHLLGRVLDGKFPETV